LFVHCSACCVPRSPNGVLTDCERDFAKQSQFMPGLMSVSSCTIKSYGNFTAGWADENKANQTQFKVYRFGRLSAGPKRSRMGQSRVRALPGLLEAVTALLFA
jgi:hypothetical protein